MKIRSAAAMLTCLALAVMVAASGCGQQSPTSPDVLARNSSPDPNGGQDTTPAPPNPPPPTPVAPLVYLGADTAFVGGTVTQRWRLTNESTGKFTMQWTLESHSVWPGLPQTGSLALAGGEARELVTTASVPDTAATGTRWLRLTVTRPGGQPDASADGWYLLRP